MQRIFREALFEIRSKWKQSIIKISFPVKGIATTTNLKDESTESKKAFYLFSFMLLISLIFLSPDKIPQTFTPTQTDNGIFEKAQDVIKIIKKLVPDHS